MAAVDQDGELLFVGPAAEQRFGHRHFMGMTAVFTAPPQFTVLAGRQEVGRTDPMLLTEKTDGPRLLLLDEPSAGLAPVVVQSIFEVVRAMSAERYTVLIVEQNIRQVLKVAHRAYLLETGRIKSSGAAGELLDSYDVRKAYLGL